MDKAAARVEKRTFSLPAEQTRYIDGLVATGTFASGSEVVRAGLRALQERDAAIERWLHDEVLPVYDAMKAEPDRGRPLSEVRERLRQKHLLRLKDEAR